ncbi:LuxR C-terminal-related transcriptional regulator [Kosakonia sp.]|uniref:response regulator transcription factor n=1 Tax=Kosakonia sp. TaxID=1916651 RepID=UPI0028B25D8B|nr:LuxR C-terminal-related transcriptional regulator [Kosakonia sp.]
MSEKNVVSIANVLIYSEDIFSAQGLTTLIKFYRPSLRISHIASPQEAYAANSNKVRFVVAVATQATNLMSLMNTMQYLRDAKPDLPCLVLSDALDPVLPALMPDVPTLCLNTPIRHIYESISRLLSRKGAASPHYSALPLLTQRQREVLCLLASGASAQDVSAELGISLKTAYVHRRDILMRLNISPNYYRGVFSGRLS